jgi:hypothetical protein
MLKASVLFFILGFLAIALGISGAPGTVTFAQGLRLFFLGQALAIATFLAAGIRRAP